MRFEKLGEDEESAIYRVHLWPVDIREGLEATGNLSASIRHFFAPFEAQLFREGDRHERWLMITRRKEGRVAAIDWLGRMLNGQPESDDPK